MSIWKDLLVLGGYVATPAALRLVAPEGSDLIDPAPAAPATPPVPEPAPVLKREVRLPWDRKADHLVLR